MIITLPYTPDNFPNYYRQFGPDPQKAFVSIASIIVGRYYDQVEASAPSDAFVSELLNLVWDSVHAQGLPSPLGPKDNPPAPDVDYSFYSTLVEQVLGQLPQHRTADHLRVVLGQLFATLLAREFKSCRLSFQETEADGECLRQNQEMCQDRISGSHCEDCPYFTALSSKQHSKLLRNSWVDGLGPDASAMRIFLPEDFRALRIFWYLYIRTVV